MCGPKYLIGFISSLCWIAAIGEVCVCMAAASVDHLLPVLCLVMWWCQWPLPCHWLRVLLNLGGSVFTVCHIVKCIVLHNNHVLLFRRMFSFLAFNIFCLVYFHILLYRHVAVWLLPSMFYMTLGGDSSLESSRGSSTQFCCSEYFVVGPCKWSTLHLTAVVLVLAASTPNLCEN